MKGSCFCGSIAFEISGDIPALYQCHCSECRKTTGAAASAGLILAKENFHWLQGEELIRTFLKDSGFRVHFCGNCGSPVPNAMTRFPQFMWIPAGLMDDVLPVKVANHVYVASKAAWDEIGGNAAQHQEVPDDLSVLLPPERSPENQQS